MTSRPIVTNICELGLYSPDPDMLADFYQTVLGLEIVGPAVVEEPTTNIVVRPGWCLVLEPNNCYRLTRLK